MSDSTHQARLELKGSFGKQLIEDFVELRLSETVGLMFVSSSMVSESSLSKLISLFALRFPANLPLDPWKLI